MAYFSFMDGIFYSHSSMVQSAFSRNYFLNACLVYYCVTHLARESRFPQFKGAIIQNQKTYSRHRYANTMNLQSMSEVLQ